MPNWVYNTLTIQGPKEEIDYIKDRLNRPFTLAQETYGMGDISSLNKYFPFLFRILCCKYHIVLNSFTNHLSHFTILNYHLYFLVLSWLYCFGCTLLKIYREEEYFHIHLVFILCLLENKLFVFHELLFGCSTDLKNL